MNDTANPLMDLERYRDVIVMIEETRGILTRNGVGNATMAIVMLIHTELLFELFIIERKCYRYMISGTYTNDCHLEKISPELEYILNLKDVEQIKRIIEVSPYISESLQYIHKPLRDYPNNHILPKEFDYIYKP